MFRPLLRLLPILVIALAAGACRKAPAATSFASPWGDFIAEAAPAGWTTRTAQDSDAFRFIAWIGPKDDEAPWGAPRIVLAWYANGKTFASASGEKLSFASDKDFIKRLERTAWKGRLEDVEPARDVSVGGRPARRRAVRAEVSAYMLLPGAPPLSQGGRMVWRRDVVVIVPTRTGFYALTYPGVEPGAARHAETFETFLAGLRFLKDSPID